jgi:hypothetical protein
MPRRHAARTTSASSIRMMFLNGWSYQRRGNTTDTQRGGIATLSTGLSVSATAVWMSMAVWPSGSRQPKVIGSGKTMSFNLKKRGSRELARESQARHLLRLRAGVQGHGRRSHLPPRGRQAGVLGSGVIRARGGAKVVGCIMIGAERPGGVRASKGYP